MEALFQIIVRDAFHGGNAAALVDLHQRFSSFQMLQHIFDVFRIAWEAFSKAQPVPREKSPLG